MNNTVVIKALLLSFFILCFEATNGFAQKKAIVNALNAADVSFTAPSLNAARFMPTGNGDISINAWVESNGDVCFFINKNDATGVFRKNNKVIKDSSVLMALGKVRISIKPASLPADFSFTQILKLNNSEIIIKEANTELRLWIDANNPIIRAEAKSTQPTEVKVILHNTRIGNGDYVVNNQSSRITWYHQNAPGSGAKLEAVTFGATIKGNNMVSKDDTTLLSRMPVKAHQIAIYPLTTTNAQTSVQWLEQMSKQAQLMDALNFEQTRKAHKKWWAAFWSNNSLFKKSEAQLNLSKINIVQSYVNAIAGNMAHLFKFDGAVFAFNYNNQ